MPLFRSFRNCFSALHSFAEYERAAKHFRRAPRGESCVSMQACPPDSTAATGVTAATGGTGRHSHRGRRGPISPGRLLDSFGVPLAGDTIATSAAAAVRAADSFGYPVVMKFASPDVAHKSDAGLVRLDVGSAAEVRSTYRELIERAESMKPPPADRGRTGAAAAVGRDRDDRRAVH